MVHYSSHTGVYEGGAKNTLKGISMKFLECARNSQVCVCLGSKEVRVVCSGIHIIPWFRGGLDLDILLTFYT